MPDPLENKEPALPGAPAASQGNDAPNLTTGGGASPAPEPPKPQPGSGAESAPEINLKGVEKKDVDGKTIYETKIGSSTYQGLTPDELWDNVREGIAAKDTFIARLRGEQTTRVTAKFTKPAEGRTSEEEEPEAVPDEREVMRQALGRHLAQHPNVTAEMLSWSDEQWKAFQKDNDLESWQIAERRQDVREIFKAAKAETESYMDRVSTDMLNRQTITQETKKVAAMVEKAGVAELFTDEMFEEILGKGIKQVNKNGVIISGSIVEEAGNVIAEILRDRKKSPVLKQLEEDIARGKKKKGDVPDEGGGGGGQHRAPVPKPAANLEEAAARALEELKAAR